MADSPPPRKAWYEILSSLTPVIVGLCVTGVGAYFTQVYNYRQLQLNQLQALDKLRPLLVSDDPGDREFAYASFVALGYQDLALKMIAVKRDNAGRSVAQDIQKTGNSQAQAAATTILQTLPAQVYVHIGDESQRTAAEGLASSLRGTDAQFMGVENVGDVVTMPKATEIRYFNTEDQAAAEAIGKLLENEGVQDVKVALVPHLTARPGTIEVWLSRNTHGDSAAG